MVMSIFSNYDPKVLTLVTKFFTLFKTLTLSILSKLKEAGQKVENVNLYENEKIFPLTKEEKLKLVGKKRIKEKSSAPFTLNVKIETAICYRTNSFYT